MINLSLYLLYLYNEFRISSSTTKKKVIMTKQEKEEAKRLRFEEKENFKYYKLQEKERKLYEKTEKQNIKRELSVLKFMQKNDVKYYHHSTEDSMLKKINEHIEAIKNGSRWCIYDPYIWNYQGEGNNYTSRCLLGNLWYSISGFESIYDVPLDGTYKFFITDSGQRGCGSYNYFFFSCT